MTPTTTHIHPIPADVLARVRAGSTDVSGNPVEYPTASGGEPLRCCLRDARHGEELALFGYEPPLPSSPYREIGAVYAHATPCDGPASEYDYPTDWHGRQQVLRAYDERGWIHPATTVHDGTDPVTALAAVLAEPGVVQVHSRNIAYGCYMFAATVEEPTDDPRRPSSRRHDRGRRPPPTARSSSTGWASRTNIPVGSFPARTELGNDPAGPDLLGRAHRAMRVC